MSKGRAQDVFRAKAPGIMNKLMPDFDLQLDDAAAVLGNFGHECDGFTAMQEIKPVVAGSKGGYGWPMWTGPRRRAYEAYCKRNKLDPASDQANYAYVFVELKGSEKKAIVMLKAAKGLAAKVKAFERGYERAGITHYDSRNQWATIALDAWRAEAGKVASVQGTASRPSDAGAGNQKRSEPASRPKAAQPSVALPTPDTAERNSFAARVLAGVVAVAVAGIAAWLGLGQ